MNIAQKTYCGNITSNILVVSKMRRLSPKALVLRQYYGVGNPGLIGAKTTGFPIVTFCRALGKTR